jgi:hypothetical protein
MCTYMMRCELTFQKWNHMLILAQSKGGPKFPINKASLGYFYCNVQLYVWLWWRYLNAPDLVAHPTLYFSVARLPKRLKIPAVYKEKAC